jgi:type IV pilus assembly protein PilC
LYLLVAVAVLWIAGLLGSARIRRGDTIRIFLDKMREKVPLVGQTFRTITLARFSKALGLLLEARVPIEESLDLASAASGNEHLRAQVRLATRQISQGEKVTEALLDTRYFPHSYLWFLANGEGREQMPQTLVDVSETYEHDVSARDRALLHLITPIAIVTIGAVIAFIVVALYMPIFTLGDAISGS